MWFSIVKWDLDVIGLITLCEGCFCNSATWRAEGDHYVGLDSKRGVAEPKIRPRALNSAQGLVGYFQKVFQRAKIVEAQNK